MTRKGSEVRVLYGPPDSSLLRNATVWPSKPCSWFVARCPGIGLREGGQVKPRVHVITLAVEDLERSLSFYRDLGLTSEGIIASEFPGDDDMAAGAIAMFQLEGGLILCVFPRSELAKDAKVPPPEPTPGLFSIGHAVESREEVDALLDKAEQAGATVTVRAYDRPFGVYSGYFEDPDGHLWEILWNPALDDV
jgi:catechol 2,3-dioxygenase-like lactoylglutathione lyase family enzyme